MLANTGERLYDTIGKLIKRLGEEAGLEGKTHHTHRKTAMQASDQGEELTSEERSASNLGTSLRNKRGHYTMRRHSKTDFNRADRLYIALSLVFGEDPGLADLMMVEPRFRIGGESSAVSGESVEARVRRLVEECDSLTPDELAEFERQRSTEQRRRLA